MSATYRELKGDKFLKPSSIVDGWAVKVSVPQLSSTTINGIWEKIWLNNRIEGYVFDRMDDDIGGQVDDFFWYKNSYGYLWKTKEEALTAFEEYWKKNSKEWNKLGIIKKEDIYLGVHHIKHENIITLIE